MDLVMRAKYAVYRAARKLKDLASELGVSTSCLYQRAKRAGLSQPRPPKSTGPKLDTAIAMPGVVLAAGSA